MTTLQLRRNAPAAILAGALSLMPLALYGQGGRGGAAPPAPPNAKAGAPVDLTGQWVSVVTEDWRYRMITPAKGDYASVPINPDGRKMADTWDPAKVEADGEQCRAYGAAAVMRVPGRIRVSWADDDTMKVETDAGSQTRMFYFKEPKSQGGDWQGVSQASWETIRGGRGGGGGARRTAAAGDPYLPVFDPTLTGSLKVVTTKMKPGYLRKNGVPYSDKAVLTEYYDRTAEPTGDSWLVVTTIVEDPTYLNQPFITSTHFRKQNDQSGWNPTSCSAR